MPVADSLKANDHENLSLAGWFELLEGPLLRYAYQLVKRPEVAQDLVQEAFLKLQTRQDTVTEPKPWLYRTIHNMAVNHHCKENRVVPLNSGEPEKNGTEQAAPEPMPDEYIARLEAIGQIRLVLRSLAPKKRELLRLKFEEDLSYKEISRQTGLSVSNVGYQLHRLLKSLASEIQKNGVFK
ncbi:MAG: RNA polymerase sigma factor YlaC [Verrucomicrobia subdivision 3 bacterium]|nr:RNA polymerase sigma factor YlaC [Limisphaerales bacterium]MCS1412699.1 RNA polymerase sigma factor YlaC [Limisphaerales bacterium]